VTRRPATSAAKKNNQKPRIMMLAGASPARRWCVAVACSGAHGRS
jgi:hypothetical protein